MNERTDEYLVTTSRNGDRQAYAKLVRRHSRRVYAVCMGILGDTNAGGFRIIRKPLFLLPAIAELDDYPLCTGLLDEFQHLREISVTRLTVVVDDNDAQRLLRQFLP